MHDAARLNAAIQLAIAQVEQARYRADHIVWTEIQHVLMSARDELSKLQQTLAVAHTVDHLTASALAEPQAHPIGQTLDDVALAWSGPADTSIPTKRGPGRPRKDAA